MKFYMNNPCKLIREINTEFSEVEVYPKFADSLEGRQWCTECLAGHGYSSHTCEPYQDVIDAINDTQASMVIVVENRLLHDKPVEFSKWEIAISKLVEVQKETEKLRKEILDAKQELSRLSSYRVSVDEEIIDSESKLEAVREQDFKESRELDRLRSLTSNQKDRVSIGGVTISMSAGELRSLIRKSIKLDKLESGGVDNWEWYGESLGDCDLDEEADSYISSMSVSGIK